jgi:DNA-binding NtrC family response regulator
LDSEFGEEADWIRLALQGESVDTELKRRDALIASAQKAARRAQSALTGLNRRLRSDLVLETVVADSDAMEPVAQRARQLMSSDAPVIICGEPGTGKETLARTIHNGSQRKKRPFVEVDCVGMTDPLLEQELFGFEKDAFQGATLRHSGAFVRANGGTVYLNKVTELSHELQGAVLRAIETGQVTPKGAAQPEHVDVRIIAALDIDPGEAKEEGSLREDFYYALTVGRLDVPPLRERQTDILRLAEDFLRDFQKRYERPQLTMSAAFKQMLMDCAWPGNVRQLRNVIEHSVIMSSGGELEAKDLPEEVLATRWTKQPGDLTPEVIRATLNRTNNNRSKAAQLLGVGRTTLWRSMKRYGIA